MDTSNKTEALAIEAGDVFQAIILVDLDFVKTAPLKEIEDQIYKEVDDLIGKVRAYIDEHYRS